MLLFLKHKKDLGIHSEMFSDGVVELAEEAGIRGSVKIMVGGAPISQSFCDEIGADYYAEDAGAAAREAVKILKTRKAS